MKILHIVECFAGGVYDFLVDLINGMPEFEHSIIYGKRENTPDNFEKDFPENTKFFYWKHATREVNPKEDFLALIELLKILKSIKNIDIIHLHSSKAGFLGRLAARILGLQNKVIYTSHGVSFLRKDVSNLKKKQFEWFEKIAYKFGGNVVACSKSEAEEFKKVGINATFIYNGIDINKYNLRKVNQSKKNQKFIIGTSGRITYQKNPKALNYIAKIFENSPDIKFVWIGDGELKNELTSKNIIITGWLKKEDLFKEIEKIDLYISTSLWEGLPLSVLEAMCMKKPLLLSNCVGNRDLVIDGYNGFIFNTEQEAIKRINHLLNNKTHLKELGLNSYKIFKEKFTIERMLKDYRHLYFSLIEKNAINQSVKEW